MTITRAEALLREYTGNPKIKIHEVPMTVPHTVLPGTIYYRVSRGRGYKSWNCFCTVNLGELVREFKRRTKYGIPF